MAMLQKAFSGEETKAGLLEYSVMSNMDIRTAT